MKTYFAGLGALVLAGFALCSTGCVTEYHSIAATPVYSGTTLPSASRVAFVMEFRGGEPTDQERADVRAILIDYFTGKGSVVVEQPSEADYLVYAVLERRNPENPSEWTVVSTSSARSLGAPGGDEFEWPAGVFEDEEFETSRFSYVGFGLFYPIWFDVWDSPWYHGRVILCPPSHRPSWYWRDDWRYDRRWHRPHRWHDHDRRRPDLDRRGPDRDRRDGDHRRDNNRPDNRDRRDNNDRRGDNDRHDNRNDHRRGDNRPGDHHNDPNWKPDNDRTSTVRPNNERRDRVRETIREPNRDDVHAARPPEARRSRPQPGSAAQPPVVAPPASQRPLSVRTPDPVRPPTPPALRRDSPGRPMHVAPPPAAGHPPRPVSAPRVVPPPARREVKSSPPPPPAATPRVAPTVRPRTESPAKVQQATRSAPRAQPQRSSSSENGARRGPPPREESRRDSGNSENKDDDRK